MITIIKKYNNRKLYHVTNSEYISLPEVTAMILNGEEFKVIEVSTGNNITKQVVAQIAAIEVEKFYNKASSFKYALEIIKAVNREVV